MAQRVEVLAAKPENPSRTILHDGKRENQDVIDLPPSLKKMLFVSKKPFMDILSHFIIKAIVLSHNMCSVIPILYFSDFYFCTGICKEETDLQGEKVMNRCQVVVWE